MFLKIQFLIVLTLIFSQSAFAIRGASTEICIHEISHLSSLLSRLPQRILSPKELRKLAAEVSEEYRTKILNEIRNAKPEKGRLSAKLFETKYVTAWVLQWDDNGTEIHDHVNSRVGIHVIEGSIEEEYYIPSSSKPNRPRTIKEGQSVALTKLPYIHRISGRHGISVHIYSPPLSEMTLYVTDPDESRPLISKGRWKDVTP